jgi:hypothetical protein
MNTRRYRCKVFGTPLRRELPGKVISFHIASLELAYLAIGGIGRVASHTIPVCCFFIKITPENPVLSLRLETEWTGMKGVSAEGRKKLNQMLKRY